MVKIYYSECQCEFCWFCGFVNLAPKLRKKKKKKKSFLADLKLCILFIRSMAS